jgi:hypothetical protein
VNLDYVRNDQSDEAQIAMQIKPIDMRVATMNAFNADVLRDLGVF